MSTKMERLEERAADLATENEHLASLCKAKDNSADYHRSELERARRMFMELYENERTLKLRFEWLEEAARDVVTSCDEHRDGLIVKLADELGIDLGKELI